MLSGSGAYSSVYKTKRISDGEIYALKRVKNWIQKNFNFLNSN